MKMKHKRWLGLAALLLALVLTVGLFPATEANATDLEFTIKLHDSYGDGWNGNELELYVNGVLDGSYSLYSGYGGNIIDSYSPENSYEFRWKKGSYASECYFEILLGSETIYTATKAQCGNFADGQVLHTIEAAPPTPVITLNLSDSYGDGWNGNKLALYVDGTFIQNYTISSGNAANYEIEYDPNKAYEFRWVRGNYSNECSFTIDLLGEEVYSATKNDCYAFTNGQVVYDTIPPVFTLSLLDSYGDGWNGNKIALYVDGVHQQDYTFTSGSSASFEVVYDTSKVYEFRWVKGQWPQECSFSIKLDEETVFTSDACNSYTNGQALYNSETGTGSGSGSGGGSGATASGTCGANATWSLENGVLTISGTGAMYDYEEKTEQPWYNYASQITSVVIGNGVTKVGNYAFADLSNVTSVSLPEGLTTIGSRAFNGCTALTSADLPDSLRHIYSYAFCNCSSLTDVVLPSQLSTLSTSCFNSTGITEITIPGSVGHIGNRAFESCPNLQTVTIKAGVNSLYERVFAFCPSLTSVFFEGNAPSAGANNVIFNPNGGTVTAYYPAGNTTWTQSAMDQIAWNVNWVCGGRCGDDLLWTYSDLGELSITGSGEMYSWSKPTDVPWNPVMSSITSVSLPSGLTTIEEYAFYDLPLTEIQLPDTLGTIWDYAFMDSDLTEIQFPENLAYIGEFAFIGTGLTEIILPDSVSYIGESAFTGCPATTIHLPSSLTTIEQLAFSGCGMTEILIPESVEVIKEQAFKGCGALNSIRFVGDAPSIADNAFDDVTANAYYPEGNSSWVKSMFQDYGGDLTWQSYLNIIASGSYWSLSDSGVLIVDSGTTYSTHMPDYDSYDELAWDAYKDQVKYLIIKGYSNVGAYAFDGFTNLKTVSGAELESVGIHGFSGCTSLESIFLSDFNLEVYIYDYAFKGCTSLKWAAFPFRSEIGQYAFDGCTALDDIYITGCHGYGTSSDGVTGYLDVADTAFRGVTATVHLPPKWLSDSDRYTPYDDFGGTLTWVRTDNGPCGSNAWWTYDADTKTITMSGTGSIARITTGHFQSWYGLFQEATSLVIEDGITVIPSYTFEFMESIQTVRLPNTLTHLNCNAFNNCKSLNNLIIPASVISLSDGTHRFNRCNALTDVYYMGTALEWDLVENKETLTNPGHVNDIVIHFLVPYGQEATCTESGYEPYYQFDDTSVYAGYYDANKQPIDEPVVAPALGHDWQDATCTEAQYCTRCGETGDAALGHNYVNGICTGCGKYYVNFQSATISLAGNIAINFYVELGQPILDDESAFMSFTLPDGTTKTAMLSDAEVSVKNGVTRYVFTCEVHAKQMADMVVAQMHLGDGTAVGDSRSYSVVTYAGYIIAHEDQYAAYPSLVNLLKAMLNYGAYSQIHFGYNVNNLANANLNLTLNDVTLQNVEAYRPKRAGSMTGLEITSVALILRSETVLRFYYTLADGYNIEDYNFVVNGKPVRPIYNQDNGRYYVDVTNIAAKDLDREYGVTVTNKAGTESLSVIASAMSYVYQVIASPSYFTEDVKDVVKAMYAYNIAANAYFK